MLDEVFCDEVVERICVAGVDGVVEAEHQSPMDDAHEIGCASSGGRPRDVCGYEKLVLL